MATGNKGGGRPAKPTALKVLHGDRSDRINDNEPAAPEAEVLPPETLSDDAREVWERLAPSLVKAGVLTVWDVDAFEMVCNALIAYRDATRQLQVTGLFDSEGGPHPALRVQRHAEQTFISVGARFGLTPSDRTKIKVEASSGEPQGRDPQRLLS